MKIAIIGAGNIGGTLGKKWANAGHEIRFGVRSPADPKFDELRLSGTILPITESLAGAEVVLLALPGAAVADFAAQHGAALGEKIVIDAANNVRGPELNSLAVLKANIPGAQFVRAFSTLGSENLVEPRIGGETVDLFYCGHAAARPVAEQLITASGLRPICLGDVDAAGLVDGMTRAWFALASGQGRGRRIAFKLLSEH